MTLFSDSYLSVEQMSEGNFRDRGSKFMAYLYPVNGESEIRSRLEELRKEHPSARHHCYAWILGAGKEAYRANDDGEPSGTAGRPIHSQLKNADLTNVLLVVVRYFGGTLLGTGGLIQAYREAAADAIRHAKVVERYILEEYKAEFPPEETGNVMRLMSELNAKITSNDFEGTSRITFLIRRSLHVELENRMKVLFKCKLHYLRTL